MNVTLDLHDQAPEPGKMPKSPVESPGSASERTSSPEPPWSRLAPGFRLGRYLVQSRRNDGSRRVAFDVRHERTGAVATAVVRPRPKMTNVVADRLRKALAQQRGYSHPNLCQVLDVGLVPGDGIYVVSQAVDGMRLADYVRSKGRSRCIPALALIVDQLRPIAAAMDGAHSAGILHGAISPREIVVDGSGKPYLTGMSPLAVLQDDYVRHLADDPQRWPYLAPEQWARQAFDGRADQFALARVVCEALDGQLRFAATTRDSARELATRAPRRPIAWLDDAANAALARALGPTPHERFASCGQFADALSRAPGYAAAATWQSVTLPNPIALDNGDVFRITVELYGEAEPAVDATDGPAAVGASAAPDKAPSSDGPSSDSRQTTSPLPPPGASPAVRGAGAVAPSPQPAARPRPALGGRRPVPYKLAAAALVVVLIVSGALVRKYSSQAGTAADPSPAVVHNDRGVDFYNMGQYNQAIAQYTIAIRLDPEFVLPYYNRGLARRDKGDWDQAIDDFTEAIRVDPKYSVAYSNRASVYNQQGNWGQAIADSTEAISRDSKNCHAYGIRGWANLDSGNLDQAIADCTEAIRLEPEWATPYNNRAAAYAKRGQFDEAIADFTVAIGLMPNWALPYTNRGQAYSLKGDTAKADADFAMAQSLSY